MCNRNASAKEALRKAMREKRTAFFRSSPLLWQDHSQRTTALLRDSPVWRKAECVGLYMPAHGELDISPLVFEAMNQGRTVLLPRCRPGERGIMDFAHCTGKDQLAKGFYGLTEPDAACPVVDAPPDLLLVPCVALDKQGYRLGYGGGYYDRHLSRPDWQGQPPFRLGVLFSFQLVDTVPRESWDTPLDGWVTEKELQWL